MRAHPFLFDMTQRGGFAPPRPFPFNATQRGGTGPPRLFLFTMGRNGWAVVQGTLAFSYTLTNPRFSWLQAFWQRARSFVPPPSKMSNNARCPSPTTLRGESLFPRNNTRGNKLTRPCTNQQRGFPSVDCVWCAMPNPEDVMGTPHRTAQGWRGGMRRQGSSWGSCKDGVGPPTW